MFPDKTARYRENHGKKKYTVWAEKVCLKVKQVAFISTVGLKWQTKLKIFYATETTLKTLVRTVLS
jgi:hypothetical protein